LFIQSGIDRIDNTLGYNIENCVSCCKDCNRAKSDKTLNEFKEWITNLYNNTIKI
jgi:5-methylcytosine-specific restriction endonuclease McrA